MTAMLSVVLNDTGISIHIPRVGDDRRPGICAVPHRIISIHIPRVGDDRAEIR